MKLGSILQLGLLLISSGFYANAQSPSLLKVIIRKSKNPEKPKRKVQNPAKIRRNHNSKRLLKYKSRNIGMIKKSIGSKQIRCSFFAYRSRNIIKHYVRVMGIIVH